MASIINALIKSITTIIVAIIACFAFLFLLPFLGKQSLLETITINEQQRRGADVPRFFLSNGIL